MYFVNAALEIFVAAWLRTALQGCVNGQLVPSVLNKCHELITVTLGHNPEEWSSCLMNLIYKLLFDDTLSCVWAK
jgi:hypothetical protein